MLTEEEKRILLKIGRTALEERVGIRKERKFKIPQQLMRPAGVFVSLHKEGQLRGCIGYLEPIKPLPQAVAECAVAAGLEDRRFSPISKDELDKIQIEISVLSKPEPAEIEKIKGRGVIISLGKRKATFLPQVWKELPEPEIFLSHLCFKAGLSPDAWKSKNLQIYVYDAEVFSE